MNDLSATACSNSSHLLNQLHLVTTTMSSNRIDPGIYRIKVNGPPIGGSYATNNGVDNSITAVAEVPPFIQRQVVRVVNIAATSRSSSSTLLFSSGKSMLGHLATILSSNLSSRLTSTAGGLTKIMIPSSASLNQKNSTLSPLVAIPTCIREY
jgi:hypothetical protein